MDSRIIIIRVLNFEPNKPRVSKSNEKEVWDGHHFHSLAVLIEAGVSPADAIIKMVGGREQVNKPVVQLIKHLRRGSSFAESFAKTCLITHYEVEILKIAEYADEIPKALKFIAAAYEKRQSRVRKFKARLWYPTAIVVVALLASLVLAMFSTSSSQLFSPTEAFLLLMVVIEG